MNSHRYVEAYNTFTKCEKDIMYNLYMKGVNRDGHVWVTYGDIQDAVVGIIESERNKKDESDLELNRGADDVMISYMISSFASDDSE